MRDVAEILSAQWRIEDSPDDTLVVHGAHSRVYLYQTQESRPEHDFYLLIDYSDVALASVIVDNDFGTVLPGDQFVALSNSDSWCDWRRRRPQMA